MNDGMNAASSPVQEEVVRQEQYREMKGFNQSFLKLLHSEPQQARDAYLGIRSEPSREMIIGTCIEAKLMGLPDKTKILDVVLKDKPLEAALMFLAKLDGAEIGPVLNTEKRQLLLECCNAVAYHTNWKDDTKINDMWGKIKDYVIINSQLQADEILISADEHAIITQAVDAVKQSPYAWIFDRHDEEIRKKYKIFYQVPIQWMENTNDGKTVACKGLIDIIVVDLVRKTVHTIDLKTTSENPLLPIGVILKYRYDFQASFYQAGLRKLGKVMGISFENYTLEAPQILFAPKKPKLDSSFEYKPLIVTLDNADLYHSEHGVIRNGYYYMGWKQAITIAQWHVENDKWDYTREVYENNMTLQVQLF